MRALQAYARASFPARKKKFTFLKKGLAFIARMVYNNKALEK